MKRKLVVLASEGIFEESSDDVDLFEDQEAWISFYQAMGGLTDDFEEVPLTELVEGEMMATLLDDIDVRNQSVRVYSGYDSK